MFLGTFKFRVCMSTCYSNNSNCYSKQIWINNVQRWYDKFHGSGSMSATWYAQETQNNTTCKFQGSELNNWTFDSVENSWSENLWQSWNCFRIVIAHVKFKLFSAFNPTFSFSYLDLFICLCQWSQFFFVTCKQVLFKIITISDCLPSHYFQILIPCVLLFVWRRMGLTKHCWWNYVAESRPVQRFHKTGCRTAPNPHETVNPSLTHGSVPDRSRTRDLLGTSAGVRVETWNPLKLDLLGKRGRRSGGGADAARRRRSRPRGRGRASSRGSVGAMGCCCLDGWMLQHGPGLAAASPGRRRWVDLCSQFVCTEQSYLLSLLCCSFPSICSFGFVNCCSFKP